MTNDQTESRNDRPLSFAEYVEASSYWDRYHKSIHQGSIELWEVILLLVVVLGLPVVGFFANDIVALIFVTIVPAFIALITLLMIMSHEREVGARQATRFQEIEVQRLSAARTDGPPDDS
jgi:hypothetical protein